MKELNKVIIETENFIVRRCDCALGRYDIYRKMTSKKGEGYEIAYAYGMTLEKAVMLISEDEAVDRSSELKSFIEEYKKISDSIINQFKSK